MSDSTEIESATRRLAAALDALDAALDRRREGERGEAVVAEQLHALGIDRARLAAELDQAVARSRQLESAHRDLAQRLGGAIESIRDLIDGKER
jgi:hypothetical protein